MKSRIPVVVVGLLACSMQALSGPPAPAVSGTSPPVTYLSAKPYAPPTPKDGKGLPPPRFCHLGSDCLALDSHPFELCRLSSQSCSDKLAEVLQVQQPRITRKPVLRLTATPR